MRAFMLVSSVFAAAYASPSVEHMFNAFLQKLNRKYTLDERARRLEIFKDNIKKIEASNAKNLSYTLGVTAHADLTFDEFRAKFVGGFIPMKFDEMAKFEKPAGLGAPESVDWVQEGAVSSVKQQGNCGSCWTFSVTGALEGAMKIAGHDLVELSQQMLLNCDWGMLGGHGCSGGNPVQAFGWVKSNGLCSSADYPYKWVNKTADKCRNAKCDKNTCTRVLKADNFLHGGGDVAAFASVGQTEGELEAAVAQQPVSVAIEADTEIFQHYTGGILESDACGQNIDHAVLVVGYGIQKGFFSAGKKYWKVKNSWGAQWGEDGYVKIAKGKTSGYGECGIRTFASFPTVKPKAAEIVV